MFVLLAFLSVFSQSTADPPEADYVVTSFDVVTQHQCRDGAADALALSTHVGPIRNSSIFWLFFVYLVRISCTNLANTYFDTFFAKG